VQSRGIDEDDQAPASFSSAAAPWRRRTAPVRFLPASSFLLPPPFFLLLFFGRSWESVDATSVAASTWETLEPLDWGFIEVLSHGSRSDGWGWFGQNQAVFWRPWLGFWDRGVAVIMPVLSESDPVHGRGDSQGAWQSSATALPWQLLALAPRSRDVHDPVGPCYSRGVVLGRVGREVSDLEHVVRSEWGAGTSRPWRLRRREEIQGGRDNKRAPLVSESAVALFWLPAGTAVSGRVRALVGGSDSAVGEGESGTQWVAGPVVLGWLVCGVGLRARGAGQAWLGGWVVTQASWTALGRNGLPHFFPSFLILFYFFFYTLLHLVNYTCIHVLPLMCTYLGGQLGVIEVCGFHVNGLATYRY